MEKKLGWRGLKVEEKKGCDTKTRALLLWGFRFSRQKDEEGPKASPRRVITEACLCLPPLSSTHSANSCFFKTSRERKPIKGASRAEQTAIEPREEENKKELNKPRGNTQHA